MCLDSRRRTLGVRISRLYGAWSVVLWLGIALPAHASDANKYEASALQEAAELARRSEASYEQGRYGDALLLAKRALLLREEALSSEHALVADIQDTLALVYVERGEYERAESLYQRALDIRERALGKDHADVAETLSNLGELFTKRAEFEQAEPLYLRALAIQEHAFGETHLQVAETLMRLGWMNQRKGEYEQAELLYQRALVLREDAQERGHPDIAEALAYVASVYNEQGEYERAEPLYLRALRIHEKSLGVDHPDVAADLNDLAILYEGRGEYERAEQMYLRALDIREKSLGQDHPNVALTLQSMAILSIKRGEYGRAESLAQRTLAINERALGKEHPYVALSMDILGVAKYTQGEYGHAESLAKRALEINESTLGKKHPAVANSLANLARVYQARGELEHAARLYQRALDIREEVLGRDNPTNLYVLRDLASVHRVQQNHVRAEQLYERALDVGEKAWGPKHPDIATVLNSLALVHWGRGNQEQALEFRMRGMDVREHSLGILMASAGSEERKRARLAHLESEANTTISFHLQGSPDEDRAVVLALETIFRFKGRVLDSMAGTVLTLRHHLDVESLDMLGELGRLRSRLATSLLRGPGRDQEAYRSRNRELQDRIDAMEAELSKQSRHYSEATRLVSVADVQSQIPAGAALVELVSYRPYDPRGAGDGGTPRYAAYVLRSQGTPQAVDLDQAVAIDALVERWRTSLQKRQPEAYDQARALDDRIMAPVRALLGGGVQHIFLAPDGELNLVPFAALVDEEGSYLIERYQLTYLTSGRDLLRAGAPEPARQDPVIIANPDFGTGRRPPARGARAGARDLIGLQASPLPGTAQEADALAARLAHVHTWTGAQATEGRLKELKRPQLLHIATHGFWLEDAKPVSLDDRTRSFTILDAPPSLAVISDPLLRSGLALAGFNKRQSGEDDGFLTALEAASLDLYGTQLVVLSACDTGLGEVRSGQGVYGLRRALIVAGAQTLVMSLWKVDDTITKDLMLAYYDRLIAGEGRSEAMRQAQLAMLRKGDTAHPYYWASFLVAGDSSPMSGLVPRPREGVSGWIGRIGMVGLGLILIGGIGILALRRRKRSLV